MPAWQPAQTSHGAATVTSASEPRDLAYNSTNKIVFERFSSNTKAKGGSVSVLPSPNKSSRYTVAIFGPSQPRQGLDFSNRVADPCRVSAEGSVTKSHSPIQKLRNGLLANGGDTRSEKLARDRHLIAAAPKSVHHRRR